jgi:hypothetical protein
MANMLESDCIADKYMDGIMPFLPFKTLLLCLMTFFRTLSSLACGDAA